MLSAQLKEQTKINHQILEKKLVLQMRSIKNSGDYTNLLRNFYGFFGGLEILIGKHPELIFLKDYAERRKSSALANDLIYYKTDLPVFATGAALPNIENDLQIIGVLYVMEGSTLGGKYIAKMIQGQLKIEETNGLTFFNGYGDQTENMWTSFKESIDGITLTTLEKETVIEAANDTFMHFSNWFDVQQ